MLSLSNRRGFNRISFVRRNITTRNRPVYIVAGHFGRPQPLHAGALINNREESYDQKGGEPARINAQVLEDRLGLIEDARDSIGRRQRRRRTRPWVRLRDETQ